MSVTDIVLVVVAILVALGGWRRGALVGVLSLAGFVAGLMLAGLILPAFIAWGHRSGWLSEQWQPLVSLLTLLAFGFVVQAVFSMIATRIRRSMGDGAVRGLDSVGGALTSIVAACLVVWLAAGFIRTTPYVAPNSWVASSRAVAGIDRLMPVTSRQALGQLGDFLSANGFPRVFDGQTEQIKSVGAPDQKVLAGVRGAAGSVVKVLTDSDRCGSGSEGSGWVLADDRIVTNAHVVAGSDSVVVQVGGVGEAHRAEVVAYDPARDVAVLKVDGLGAAPLHLAGGLSSGDSAVVAGFPNNGSYTLAPSRVRQVIDARGLDIYGDKSVRREIYSLRGIVRPGNSGGPLLNAKGEVSGVVFAKSTADDETGYALTLDEVAPVLAKGKGSTAVPTGACLAA